MIRLLKKGINVSDVLKQSSFNISFRFISIQFEYTNARGGFNMEGKSYISKTDILVSRKQIKKERHVAYMGVVILELIIISFCYFIHWVTPTFLKPLMTVAIAIFGGIGVVTPFVLLGIVLSATNEHINRLNTLSPETKPVKRVTFRQFVGYRWRRYIEFTEDLKGVFRGEGSP